MSALECPMSAGYKEGLMVQWEYSGPRDPCEMMVSRGALGPMSGSSMYNVYAL